MKMVGFFVFGPLVGIGRHFGFRNRCFGVRVRVSQRVRARMVKLVNTLDLKSNA